jgi:signal transduction histidine kinase/ActR/RegA family two-component response regulator
MSKSRLAKPYMYTVIAAGAAVLMYSALNLETHQLDFRFVLLALITIGLASRIAIQIPRISGQITVSDTFVFLTMLIYGGEAAILLAAAEGVCSSLRISRKPITVVFNSSMMATATFLTVCALRYFFGNLTELAHETYSGYFVMAIYMMALVHYIANSGLVAVAQALKTNEPVWHTWKNYYLWTSITYFAGASAAGISARFVDAFGVYAFIITTPIIVVIYFTYKTYLKNVEATAAAAAAEQAQQHVEELSRYIAEQERIREQFSQLEKLSALGELASGVAHDFNNTLAGILGRAQLLQRTDDLDSIKSGLKIITKTAEDGAKTIKRIQDFARQRKDHDFAPVAVDQLLFDVSEITRPRWKDRAQAANVQISLDLQIRSNALVMGDASEMREVLVNMVFNAVDAMPDGGRLTLSAEEVDGEVEISVRDTGVGMTQEVRSRIFDPFFTTKGKAGMGLGLAVGYGIVRRHEGIILVESAVGHGTTFRIRMPMARGAVLTQPTGELVAPVKPVRSSSQTHILVVDDEDYVRELLRDILETDGFEVTLATNGREALMLYDGEKFDAVFTDVGLPGMSGWEFARAIRERSRRIPIAVITGWGEAVGSSEQKKAQVDWVVAKPFTVDRILEITREVSLRKSGKVKSLHYNAA